MSSAPGFGLGRGTISNWRISVDGPTYLGRVLARTAARAQVPLKACVHRVRTGSRYVVGVTDLENTPS